MEETRISAVRNMVQELGLTLERAMDVLKIPEDAREAVKLEVQADEDSTK